MFRLCENVHAHQARQQHTSHIDNTKISTGPPLGHPAPFPHVYTISFSCTVYNMYMFLCETITHPVPSWFHAQGRLLLWRQDQ